jgi:hypothetical protein
MIRKVLSGLVLVGAVVVSLSQAQAATEVMRFPANNTFANAISIDPVTGNPTGIFVSRHKGDPGGPVDTLFYTAVLPDGTFISGGGILPKNAFHVDGHAASLNVDVHDMVLDPNLQNGPVPTNGEIHVFWDKTGVERTSGSTQFNVGTMHVLFVGTSNTAACDIDASAFGADLPGPFGDVRSLTSAVIVITKD